MRQLGTVITFQHSLGLLYAEIPLLAIPCTTLSTSWPAVTRVSLLVTRIRSVCVQGGSAQLERGRLEAGATGTVRECTRVWCGLVHPDPAWILDPSKVERSPAEGTGAQQPEPSSGGTEQPTFGASRQAEEVTAQRPAHCVESHLGPSCVCLLPRKHSLTVYTDKGCAPSEHLAPLGPASSSRAADRTCSRSAPRANLPGAVYPVLLEPASLFAAELAVTHREADCTHLYPVYTVPEHIAAEGAPPTLLPSLILYPTQLSQADPPPTDTRWEPALESPEGASGGPLIVTRASVVTASIGQDDDNKMSQDKKKKANYIMFVKRILMKNGNTQQGIGKPSVYHAVVVIFLEFFAWGLLTTPMLVVLHETFPQHTFLMNGLIQGVKGFLSFMSAPLIGALSDVYGRKSFLLVTVFFTCFPIPLMRISPWWYFAMISVSGAFSVTFSVIFAYVADITQEHERSTAYGLVSATFAASLVTSPAIGAYISAYYGDNLVVLVATVVALLDICFILLVVPESLREKMRSTSWGVPISWEQADPFTSLKKVGKDSTVLLICITVFFSYLPEAGQYSSFFLYLRQIIGFNPGSIAAFIAVVGILSIVAQTVLLSILMRSIGNKNTVLLGLGFQMFQLAWYGFGSQPWMMWAAGAVAAMSSITFPAVSALISRNAESDQQGVAQGMVTGIRGLCNGLGPALYGFVFFLFHVELSGLVPVPSSEETTIKDPAYEGSIIPGPPFLFGACAVLLAFLVALFIPEHGSHSAKNTGIGKHSSVVSSTQTNHDRGSDEDIEPLLQDSSL